MLPSLNTLLATLACGLFVVLLIALVREIRGVVPDLTRPPSMVDRALQAVRRPSVLIRLAAAATAGVAALVITRWPVMAAAMAALVLLWPKLFGGRRAEELQLTRLEALVIFTESVRDTTSAHSSLEHAIPAAAANAPAILRPALVRLVGQLRSKVPMDRALGGLAAELDDSSADLVIAALILNSRRRGDRLVEVLSSLSTSAREELEMRRKVAVGRRSIRMGAQFVVWLTLGMVLFFSLLSPAYVEPYRSAQGQIVLGVVVGIFGFGFWWLRKLATPSPAAPFLARPGKVVDDDQTDMILAMTSKLPTTHGGSR